MIVYLTCCCISIFYIILLSSKNWKLKQWVQTLLAVTHDRSTLGPSYKGRLLSVCGRKSFPVVCLWTGVVPCCLSVDGSRSMLSVCGRKSFPAGTSCRHHYYYYSSFKIVHLNSHGKYDYLLGINFHISLSIKDSMDASFKY